MKLKEAKKFLKLIQLNEITAQFASKADIDNFKNKPSLEYVGTGEGGGVEGFGLYFSTSKETHDYYAQEVGSKSYVVDLNVNDKELIFYDFLLSDVFENIIHTVPHWYKQCITKVLWPNRDKILEFYKHIFDLRGRKVVLNFVRRIGKDIYFKTPTGSMFRSQKEFAKIVMENINGFAFYMLLEYLLNGNKIEGMIRGNKDPQWGKSATEFLLKVGCKGIKYLDHGSREYDTYYHDRNWPGDIEMLRDNEIKSEITFNYVIFDKNAIKIKWKKDDYSDVSQSYHGMLDWNKEKSGTIKNITTNTDTNTDTDNNKKDIG